MLAKVCTHCASKSSTPTGLPSRSTPTWPAMNRYSDALTRVMCEYWPSGLPSASGLTILMSAMSVSLWRCADLVRAKPLHYSAPRLVEDGNVMKIVGFEVKGELHLGVVEGNEVIDLQAADAKAPHDLREWLARDGDLKALGDLAKLAPASARRPLEGLKYALPVARPGKVICLGLNYMEHVKEGRYANDPPPKFPSVFMRCQTSLVPHDSP